MNLSSGIDLIEIERIREAIERHGDKFVARIFTEYEQKECKGRIPSLAARFAARPAILAWFRPIPRPCALMPSCAATSTSCPDPASSFRVKTGEFERQASRQAHLFHERQPKKLKIIKTWAHGNVSPTADGYG